MLTQFSRTELLLGKEGMERLKNARVAVFGIGGSLLYGLEELIESKTGITTMTAEDPMTAVAIGTGRYVEFLSGEVTIGDAN